VETIVNVLVKDFAYSTQSNPRKGGLIGLAACAIALMEHASRFLNMLLPPVLSCFTDQESRVRYYACEALYNIIKVARGSVLGNFNVIFDGVCKLYADPDAEASEEGVGWKLGEERGQGIVQPSVFPLFLCIYIYIYIYIYIL
jgi:hypothetical protein